MEGSGFQAQASRTVALSFVLVLFVSCLIKVPCGKLGLEAEAGEFSVHGQPGLGIKVKANAGSLDLISYF